MKTLHFQIDIKSPASNVWDVLWNPKTYPQWTRPFGSNSYMESDWRVGGRTLFKDGEKNGMISTIRSKEEPNEIVFEHLGMMKDGIEKIDQENEAWSGALEKYSLEHINDITRLTVEVDSMGAESETMLNNAFPDALKIVKKISEEQS